MNTTTKAALSLAAIASVMGASHSARAQPAPAPTGVATPSPDPEPGGSGETPAPVKVVPVQQPDGRVVLVPISQLSQPQPQVVVVETSQRDRPEVLPYVEGDPIPRDYRRDEKPITGLVIAGPIVLGVGWLTSSMVGLLMAADRLGDDNGFLAMTVPVVGGLITIGTAKDRHREGAAIGGVMSFVVQSAGAGMLIGGLAGKRQILRRVGLVPSVRIGPGGGTLRWQF